MLSCGELKSDNWSCISCSEIQVNESYDWLWLIFHLIINWRYRLCFISAFPSKIKMVNEYLIGGWVCGWVTYWRIFWGMICLDAHGNAPLLSVGFLSSIPPDLGKSILVLVLDYPLLSLPSGISTLLCVFAKSKRNSRNHQSLQQGEVC